MCKGEKAKNLYLRKRLMTKKMTNVCDLDRFVTFRHSKFFQKYTYIFKFYYVFFLFFWEKISNLQPKSEESEVIQPIRKPWPNLGKDDLT